MNEYVGKRLNTLASSFFALDCERENLLFKLEQLNDRINEIKSSIQFSTGYSNERLLYELNELVLEICPDNISVYTNDQFEKVYPEEALEDI